MRIEDLRKYKLVLIYFIGSIAWIMLSEAIINKVGLPPDIYDIIQLGKGIVYVIVTTILIYFIIKKHEAYKKAEENQNELMTLINAMPDFVCFKDGQGRWRKVNDFGKELYTLENIDYCGKTDADLAELVPFFKEPLLYCDKSDQEAWDAVVTTRCEESFTVPNGEIKTFDVIKVPFFDDDGNRKGLLTIGRDITQLKAAETMLLRKEKLSVVGELAAGIAHEIRNPLTSIKGFIQLMKESKETPKEHYEIILSELDRINQIVGEMLVFSKPQTSLSKPFYVDELIDYVLKITSHEAILYGIEVISLNKPKDVVINGDMNQLVQVFINIIKNSIDAMPKGGKITINIEQDEEIIRIHVADTGIGIPNDRLSKIGEPFFTLKEKGMGLGLTISNKIIHDHHGTLEIKSEVNKGTTVVVSFPIYK